MCQRAFRYLATAGVPGVRRRGESPGVGNALI